MRSLTFAAVLLASMFAMTSFSAFAGASIDPNTVVVCPGGGVEPFAWGVLKGPRSAEKDKTASAWLLRKMIREKQLEFMPRSRWFVIARGQYGRTLFIQYASGDIDGLTTITFTRKINKKRWAYSHSEHGYDCDPRLLTKAGRAATWWYPVAEQLPTNPTARSVQISASEEGCNSGRDAAGRVFADAIEYTPTEVRIRIDIRPNPGAQTCPGHPSTLYDVPLSEPIGDRSIVDIAGPVPRTRVSAKQLAAVRAGANPLEELLFDKSDADFCRDEGPFGYGSRPTKDQERRWQKRAAASCPRSAYGF